MNIEAAAVAAFNASFPPSSPSDYKPTWGDLDEHGRWFWRHVAQAAVDAARGIGGAA